MWYARLSVVAQQRGKDNQWLIQILPSLYFSGARRHRTHYAVHLAQTAQACTPAAADEWTGQSFVWGLRGGWRVCVALVWRNGISQIWVIQIQGAWAGHRIGRKEGGWLPLEHYRRIWKRLKKPCSFKQHVHVQMYALLHQSSKKSLSFSQLAGEKL